MSRKTLHLTPEIYDYILAISVKENKVQTQLREKTGQMSQGNMQISPEQGQLMRFLTRMIGGKRVIEIGTFTGYSALCFALSILDGGEVVTCDINDEWTKIARQAWEDAGVDHKITLRLGSALETLPALFQEKGIGYFDLAFIDADKANYDAYYEHCLNLVRPGGLILLDNMLWSGSVADPSIKDKDTKALRDLNAKLSRDSRVEYLLLPIGDGLGMAWRLLY